jgi:hypothetical protein
LTSNALEESLALGASVLREAGVLLLTRPRFGHLCPDPLPAVIHNRISFSHPRRGRACSHPLLMRHLKREQVALIRSALRCGLLCIVSLDLLS